MREVYVGNGRTITVDDSSKNIKYVDTDLLEEIKKNNPDKEVVFGMAEDWYFTASTLKEAKITKGILASSSWATPVVRIDDGEDIPCFIEVDDKVAKIVHTSGVNYLKDRLDMRAYGLTDFLLKLPYIHWEGMKKDLSEIVKKYSPQ
jgi:hypothetical protein